MLANHTRISPTSENDSYLSEKEYGGVGGKFGMYDVGVEISINPENTRGQKFQKVENDENRFFAITSSKLSKN